MADMQEQVTELYNKLVVVNSNLEKRALNATVNTMESILRSEFDSIAENVAIIQESVRQIQLDITNIITQLRG